VENTKIEMLNASPVSLGAFFSGKLGMRRRAGCRGWRAAAGGMREAEGTGGGVGETRGRLRERGS